MIHCICSQDPAKILFRPVILMNGLASLSTVPQEVLEHIAFYAGTDSFLGPPASLIPLLLCSKTIHESLSFSSNHHLYARIFYHKFDVAAPLARLGPDKLNSAALASELRRRFVVLKRLKIRVDSKTHAPHSEANSDKMTLRDILLTAYIMLLENEGKNKRQLLEFGRMGAWIREFWFDQHGASRAIYNIRIGKWPINQTESALAMWIFWFLLKGGESTSNDTLGLNGNTYWNR